MPIYEASDSERHTMRGFEAVWRDTSRHRQEDTSRLCGPVGKARPWPAMTLKALAAPQAQHLLPEPDCVALARAEKFGLVAADGAIAVLPRPVAEWFITAADGNLYVGNVVRWIAAPERTKMAESTLEDARAAVAKADFQLAAERAAISAGITLCAVVTNHADAAEERGLFAEAWSILTSLLPETAFMEMVGEMRFATDTWFRLSKMYRSEIFWKSLFPERRPAEPEVVRLVGDERAENRRERDMKAREKRIAAIEKRSKVEQFKAVENASNRARIAALRREVAVLTRYAR